MKRLTASILALGLAASVGTASAQTNGYYSQYGTPTPDRYGQSTYGNNAQYDYARVIRVDPVTGSYGNYPTSNGAYNNGAYNNGAQRCYQQERNGGYVGNDSYNRDGNYGNDGYRSDGYRDDGYYGRDDQSRSNGGSQTARTVATVVGGIAGAVLGSKVGGGSGSYAASAIGSMVGGMAGRSIYDNTQQRRREPQGVVTVCDPVPADGRSYQSSNYPSNNTYNTRNGVNSYDVTYEYAGRRYTTRTNYHPGERIRVRVDVRPE